MTSWKDSLLVGISIMDSQHKGIFESIDSLMVACMKEKDCAIRKEMLLDISISIKDHVEYENEILAKYAYPHKEDHMVHHARLVAELDVLVEFIFQNERSRSWIMELHNKLIYGLVKHIKTEDRKVGEFVLK